MSILKEIITENIRNIDELLKKHKEFMKIRDERWICVCLYGQTCLLQFDLPHSIFKASFMSALKLSASFKYPAITDGSF